MLTDSVIVICAFCLACSVRSRAAFALFFQHLTLFIAVHLWWENSNFWYLEYFPDYHLACSLFNLLFLIAFLIISSKNRLLIIGSSLLVISNLTALYARLLFVDGAVSESFQNAVINLFPAMRLSAVALQLVGILSYVDRNGGKYRNLFNKQYSAHSRNRNFYLSYSKINK